jgi:hypothetical protein
MGTADYVSPEQAKDARSADIRSDVYSLGCTLYFLLSGRPPFRGASLVEVATKHITEEPEPLTNVPADLWAVVAKMMAKRPEDRYQTPAVVVEALRPFTLKRDAAGLSSAEFVVVPPPLPKPSRGVAPWVIAGGIAAVLAMAALIGALSLNSKPGPVARGTKTRPALNTKTEPPAPEARPEPPAPKDNPPTKNDNPPAKDDPPAKDEPPVKAEDPPPPPADGPDRILERLDKAKADFQAACDKLKERLLQDFQAEERLAEEKGRDVGLTLLRQERERFKSDGTLPKMPGMKQPVTDYSAGLTRARRGLDDALAAAVRDYRAAGQTEKADGVAAEQVEVKKIPAAARPAVRREPVVIAEWEQTVSPRGRASSTGTVRMYSNGRLGSPNSDATWRQGGNLLEFRWPDRNAPGGAWVDTLVLSADGKRYAGKNNNARLPTRITGTRTK